HPGQLLAARMNVDRSVDDREPQWHRDRHPVAAQRGHGAGVGVGDVLPNLVVRQPERSARLLLVGRAHERRRFLKATSLSLPGSRGSPSVRSPMMLRWISLVPPPNEGAKADSAARCTRA